MDEMTFIPPEAMESARKAITARLEGDEIAFQIRIQAAERLAREAIEARTIEGKLT